MLLDMLGDGGQQPGWIREVDQLQLGEEQGLALAELEGPDSGVLFGFRAYMLAFR